MIKRLFEFSALWMMGVGSACAATVAISEPIVRAMPAGVPNTAGYMQLTAQGHDDVLLSAQCDGINTTELHTLLMEDGMMKMRPVDGIALAADTPVTLSQGGYHLMMMGMQTSFEIGDAVPCTLRFKQAEPVTVNFMVQRIDQPSKHHHH